MGLVLLAAVSLLALMATNGMVLQRHMSANYAERSRALANATRAAAAAASWLYSRPDFERESGCSTDCQLPTAVHAAGQLPRNPEFESTAWWASNANAAGSHPETGEALYPQAPEPSSPRWLIEELAYQPLSESGNEQEVAGIGYYRVLARGQGRSPGSVVVTESILARPWDGEFTVLPYPPGPERESFCRQFPPSLACGTQGWRQRR